MPTKSVVVACHSCGVTFNTTSKRITDGRGRYCSRACLYESRRIPREQSLWGRVDIRGQDECWPWVGCQRQSFGYGAIRYDGRQQSAHRVAYILTYGPVPEGLVVCHSCDNPACCNPRHLRADTQSANIREASARNRMRRYENHHNGKLTREQKVEIRQVYAAGGVTLKWLAKQYGVTPQTIWRTVHAQDLLPIK